MQVCQLMLLHVIIKKIVLFCYTSQDKCLNSFINFFKTGLFPQITDNRVHQNAMFFFSPGTPVFYLLITSYPCLETYTFSYLKTIKQSPHDQFVYIVITYFLIIVNKNVSILARQIAFYFNTLHKKPNSTLSSF